MMAEMSKVAASKGRRRSAQIPYESRSPRCNQNKPWENIASTTLAVLSNISAAAPTRRPRVAELRHQ